MSHNHHDHDHSHGAVASKNITIVFVLNIFFAALEFVFGVLFNSTAVLSDAVHDTGDAVAIGLAWFFQKFSLKKEDDAFTLGYQRFSLLGAVITSVILITGSAIVITESIPRLLHPEPVQAYGMFWLAIFAVIMNGFGAWLLSRGQSRNESILNLHMLEDVLGWVGVLIVSIVMHFAKVYWLDPLLSLGIALFILSKALPKFVGTIRILLEGTPENVDFEKLLRELEALPTVRAVTQLCIWSIDGEDNAAMLHIMLPKGASNVQAKEDVRDVLHKNHVEFSAIEIDTSNEEHLQHSH
ncbi:MAG: cation diffusion facilitator family transporter [Lactobacillales bacterium]|jgi:cobalt-zinc-cadmium efflux system protein|nr:cation diffusion facilitator family transporter [Lactobacillales bacterium]